MTQLEGLREYDSPESALSSFLSGDRFMDAKSSNLVSRETLEEETKIVIRWSKYQPSKLFTLDKPNDQETHH